nr:magnesium transporter [Alcaligenes sp. HPC1271]
MKSGCATGGEYCCANCRWVWCWAPCWGRIGFIRIEIWQHLGLYDYGEHSLLIAFTIWLALVGIVTFGSCIGSMLPFILQRVGFDPASASAPLVATLVDVLGLVIYFSVAAMLLTGTLL